MNVNVKATLMRDRVWSQEGKQTFKWVAVGVAIFGIAILSRKLYTKFFQHKPPASQAQPSHSQQSPTNKPSQRQNTKITEYSQFYFDKDLELQYIESTLPENPSVQDIYLNAPEIAKDEFIKYTREMRKRRRLIRKTNQDQYIGTILGYEGEIQELLFRSRMELVEYLGMDIGVFENMEENYEAIEDLRALNRKSEQLLRHKLLTQTKQKPLSLQTLTKIIQDQLCFIHNKMYDRLRQKLQKEMSINQSEILLVVETLMEDIVYEKFGYEKEDIVRKVREVGYDTRDLEEARRKMEIDIGDFNFDSLESLGDPDSVYEDDGAAEEIKRSVKTLHKSQSDTSEP